MFTSFWNSPFALAVAVCLALGIATPFLRLAAQDGATAFTLCGLYALCTAALALLEIRSQPLELGTLRGGLWALVACAILTVGYRVSLRAFSRPGGEVSALVAIMGAYPLISTAIGVAFLGEGRRFRSPLGVVAGTLVVVAGVAIIGIMSGPKTEP